MVKIQCSSLKVGFLISQDANVAAYEKYISYYSLARYIVLSFGIFCNVSFTLI